jgi:hypothetical protein
VAVLVAIETAIVFNFVLNNADASLSRLSGGGSSRGFSTMRPARSALWRTTLSAGSLLRRIVARRRVIA